MPVFPLNDFGPLPSDGSQALVGPGQPFRIQAQAVDLDTPELPLHYLWVQVAGPDTALFNDVTLLEPTVVCNSLGTYLFQLSVTNGFAIVSTEIAVAITNIYRAAAEYTAVCGSGSNGKPVTVIASYSSSISAEDAEENAVLAAQSQAYAALNCVDNLPPRVTIKDYTPSIAATVTYTASCVPPDVGTPVILSYTFSDTGRPYASIESSALSVAKTRANAALSCTRGNVPPVYSVLGFNASVTATATATATCPEVTAVAYGPPVTVTKTLTLSNLPYREVENRAYALARATALANLICKNNIPPVVTIVDYSPLVTATVTVVVQCPTGNKGAPVKVTSSFTSYDYGIAETTAVNAAYTTAYAALNCTPNVPPIVYIVTETDLTYRVQVPYRSNNSYRSAVSSSLDFLYTASATVGVSCPKGTYGLGAYATVSATSTVDYPTAEANAIAAATKQAAAQLTCNPTPERFGLRLYNAIAGQNLSNVQVLGVYRLTSGTLAVPKKMKFLGTSTLPLSYPPNYLDSILYLDDGFNDVLAGTWSYAFYFGRPHSDGSYVFLPDSVPLRLDGVYPGGGAAIGSLAANPNAGILSAASGVLTLNGIETLGNVAFSIASAPYLALDAANWAAPGTNFAGVMILQTNPSLTTILNYGLVLLTPPSNLTETSVSPIPFIPTFTDPSTPLTFIFLNATAGGGPLGYTLASGWNIGPIGATVPFPTDYSLVAATKAATNNAPPFTVLSYAGTPTLASPVGPVTLPAANSNVAAFASTEDVKVVLRKHRQALF